MGEIRQGYILWIGLVMQMGWLCPKGTARAKKHTLFPFHQPCKIAKLKRGNMVQGVAVKFKYKCLKCKKTFRNIITFEKHKEGCF